MLANLHPEKPKVANCGNGGSLLYFKRVLLALVQTFVSSKVKSCVLCLEDDLDLLVSSGAWDTISQGSCILAEGFRW